MCKLLAKLFMPLVIFSVMLMTAALQPGTTLAQATTTKTVMILPIEQVFSAEALAEIAACVGETVNFTEGVFKIVTYVTILPSGETKVRMQGRLLGVRGTGETSGAVYLAVGGFSSKFEEPEAPPFVSSHNEVFNVISQGAANNFFVHFRFHLTVNANGVTTVEVVRACRIIPETAHNLWLVKPPATISSHNIYLCDTL